MSPDQLNYISFHVQMSSMSSWQQISPVFTIQQRLLLGLWPLDVQYELSPCVSPYIVYLVSCLCVATAVTPAPASLHHTQLGLVMENICCWPKLRRGGDVWQCLEQSVSYPETWVASNRLLCSIPNIIKHRLHACPQEMSGQAEHCSTSPARRGCVEMLYLRGFHANVTATRILSPFSLDAALFIRVYTNKFHLEII